MGETRWIYTVGRQATYYRVGDNIYTKDGTREFWVSGTWWHSSRGAEYYEIGNYVYTKDDKPAFHY